MSELIAAIIIGVICIVIGILNMHGNISMIHSYHRKRISEADIIPFAPPSLTEIR